MDNENPRAVTEAIQEFLDEMNKLAELDREMLSQEQQE